MKSSMTRILLVISVLTVVSFAQVPDAPSTVKHAQETRPPNRWLAPLKDPVFYVGSLEFAASAIADVHSTKVCERNLTCVEAYKGHDSYGYIAPQIALVAAGSYGCSMMLQAHRRWRIACLAVPLIFSIQHWKDASTIYREDYHAKP